MPTSIQGYGPLTTIPAYYGLVWISPVVAERIALRALTDEPIVTFWSLGWGDVWRRMAEGLKIVPSVQIVDIDRGLPPVASAAK